MARLDAADNTSNSKLPPVEFNWQTQLHESCREGMHSVSQFAKNIENESRVFGTGIACGTGDALIGNVSHQPVNFSCEIIDSSLLGGLTAFTATRFPTLAKPIALIGAGGLLWAHVDPTRPYNRALYAETVSIWRDTWNSDKATQQVNELRAARALGTEGALILEDTFGALAGAGLGIKAGTACRELDATHRLLASLSSDGKALHIGSWNFSENTDYLLKRLPSLSVANKIREVDLRGTNLSGKGISELVQLQNLEHIKLPDANALPGESLSNLQYVPNLRALDLGASATDESLRSISGIKRLTELNMKQAENVTDIGLKHLSKLTNLEYLQIQNADKITARGLSDVGDNLRHLKYLSVYRSAITDAGAAHIGNLKNLERLDISHTKIEGAGLEKLSKLKSLVDLHADSLNISDAAMLHVGKLTKLRSLELNDNQLGDAGIKHLQPLKQLRYLSMRNTEIADEGVKHLNSLKRIEYLNISSTGVSDRSIPALLKMPHLVSVSARHSRISNAGLERLP